MKNIKSSCLIMSVLFMALFACSDESNEQLIQGNEIKLTGKIISTSRVTNQNLQSTQIVKDQKVGVTIVGANIEHENVAWKVGLDGALANTGNAISWGTGDAFVVAYHPYNYNWTETSHTYSVNVDQTTEEGYLSSDLLWATTTASPSYEPIELSFVHKLSRINVTLTSSDIEDLSDAIICICGTNLNTNFNPKTGDLSSATTSNVQEIKASITSEKDYTASAIVVPQIVAGGTKFIKVDLDDKTYYYTLSDDKEFKSGYSYNFTLNIEAKEPKKHRMIGLTDRISMHSRGIALQYTGIESFEDFYNVEYDEAIGQEIYSLFDDAFDFIFFLYNTSGEEFSYGGFSYSINRDIEGIGRENADISYRFGNPKQLKSISHLTLRNSIFSGGPFLHELAHYWGAANIGQEHVLASMGSFETESHWGTSDIHGILGGFDYNTLERDVDGISNKYKATCNIAKLRGFDGFSQELSNGYYAPLELYMMGLLPAEEVPDMHVFKNVSLENDTWGDGTFYADSEITLTIEDFITKYGKRIPDCESSQKDFRALVVVVTNEPVSDEHWDLIESDILKQEKPGTVNDGVQTNFWEATGGRATLTISGVDKFLKK